MGRCLPACPGNSRHRPRQARSCASRSQTFRLLTQEAGPCFRIQCQDFSKDCRRQRNGAKSFHAFQRAAGNQSTLLPNFHRNARRHPEKAGRERSVERDIRWIAKEIPLFHIDAVLAHSLSQDETHRDQSGQERPIHPRLHPRLIGINRPVHAQKPLDAGSRLLRGQEIDLQRRTGYRPREFPRVGKLVGGAPDPGCI